jgi:hypothetical protein
MLEESLQQPKKKAYWVLDQENPPHSHNILVVLCNYQFVDYIDSSQ